MPKAWCRENRDARARFEVEESVCWATHRVGLRHKKQQDEKMDPVMQRATQVSPRFRPGYEPDINAGLGLLTGSGDEEQYEQHSEDQE